MSKHLFSSLAGAVIVESIFYEHKDAEMGSHELEGPRSTKGTARSPMRVHRIPGLRLHTGLRLLPPEGQGDVAVWPALEEAALPSHPPVSSSPGGGPASNVQHLSGELR